MNNKKFVKIILLSISTVLIFSFLLVLLDISISINDTIRKYQLSRVENDNSENIFVGDSSGANAINPTYFSMLSGQKSETYFLTGSYGILGSLGIIKKVAKNNNKLKNIIIIHTLDLWERSFPTEAVLQLFPIRDIVDLVKFNDLLSYYLNPKEIWWHFKSIIKPKKFYIDAQNNYISQSKKRFSNGQRILTNESLNHIKISDSKILELDILQNFCTDNNLNCIFVNGPIHVDLSHQSRLFHKYFDSNIKSRFTINYIDKKFEYENKMIGDSIDHIDDKYIDTSTLDYYNALQKYLIK